MFSKTFLIGRLGDAPVVRNTNNDGSPVANFSIATTEKWTDKQSGEKKEATEWHNIVFYGNVAEIAGKYLQRGSLVFVEGQSRNRPYESSGVTKHKTEIKGTTLKMLDGKKADHTYQDDQNQGQGGYHNQQHTPQGQGSQNGYDSQPQQGNYPPQGQNGHR